MKKLLLAIGILFFFSQCGEDQSLESGPSGSGSSVGTGGSLARFTIINDHLFIVDNQRLKVFSLNNPENPIYMSDQRMDAVVETVFPYNDSILFIGTTSGMLIYDVSRAPAITRLSRYEHIVACDPVVARGNYAYVTLREDVNSRFCGRTENQLEIVNISDLRQPYQVSVVPMINPKGLGIYGDTLLVCDRGIKVFNVSNPEQPTLITAIDDYEPFDIIPNKDLMILVGEEGLNQYRYRKGKLNFLSSL